MQSDKTPDSKPGETATAEPESQDSTLPSLSQKDINNQCQNTPSSGSGDRSLIGEIIENQYKVVSVLGKGGMSVVYKATHIALNNKTVAIKTMHSHLISDSNALLRFKQEAQAACQLNHPNVINVYGFGTAGSENPQPYICMDYIEGESLSEAVKRDGLMPIRETLRLFRQVCNALSHAHSKGVIHRDIKPSNIMLLGKPAEVKIVDFGIAKVLPQEGEQAHRLTQTGEIFGSPMYMSPEQCMGQAVDKRSDIYSLGCVLYEALAGKPPLHGANVFETFNMHIKEIPAPLDLPGCEKALLERLDAVVFRSLEKQADKRYQSMADFEKELAALETEIDSGLHTTSLRLGLARQQRSFKRFVRSFPKVVALFLLISCALAATVFFSWQRYSWFFENHNFQPNTTRWFYFLQARRKSNLSAAEKQIRLDHGAITLKITRLNAGDSNLWLENWRSRAKLCAELDSPKDEMEAWQTVVNLEKKINGQDSSDYGSAAEALAECQISQGDYKEAIPLLVDAATIREEKGTSAPKVQILLAYAYGRSGKFKESIKQLDKAIQQLSNTDYRLTSLAYAIRADEYVYSADHDKAQRQQSLEKADENFAMAQKVLVESGKLKSLMNEITLMRAFVNLELGKFKQAAAFYAMSMPYAEKQFSEQAKQMQQILDCYAYSSWKSGDIIKAGELHTESNALGNTTNIVDTAESSSGEGK